jgi:SP family sugar:H+ symporter-like MFS transporter
MGFLSRKKADKAPEADAHVGEMSASQKPTPAATTPATLDLQTENVAASATAADLLKKQPVTAYAVILGAIASIGGFMFGYESGQIGGMSEIQQPP